MWHQIEDFNHNALHIFVDDSLPDNFNLADYDKYSSIIVIIPYLNAEAISIFQNKFKLLCADSEYICLYKSEGEVPTPSSSTREAFALIWDKTHNYILIEVPKNDTDIFHLPGGHIHHYESSKQGLIRECQEEIGLDITKYPIKQLEVIEYQHPEKIKPFDQYQVLFYYEVQSDLDIQKTNLRIQESEVSNLYWAQIAELKNRKMTEPLRLIIEDAFKHC